MKAQTAAMLSLAKALEFMVTTYASAGHCCELLKVTRFLRASSVVCAMDIEHGFDARSEKLVICALANVTTDRPEKPKLNIKQGALPIRSPLRQRDSYAISSRERPQG